MRNRLTLRFIALGYLFLLLAAPVGLVFYRTFENGFGPAWEAVTTPEAQHAFWLTMVMVAVAVPINTVFGVITAIVLVRHQFPGKALMNAAIDLPFAVSPVVIGLALILVYGHDGWFGGWLTEQGIQVIFSYPGMILATIFVSLPFVVREVVPVLREIGTEQEQAASTLGATWWQTFWRVTLPVDPLGADLRRRACDRPRAGRVRRGERRLREIVRGDRDRYPVRRAALPPIRSDRCICGIGRARADGAGGAAVDEPAQHAQEDVGGRRASRSRTSPSRFEDFQALRDVSISVPEGSLTALLGPSGSGKSTLLRVIAGLERPDRGRVLISGQDATLLRPQDRGVGFVFQHYAAFKHMTVFNNIAFGLKIRKREKRSIKERVRRAARPRAPERVRRPLPGAALGRPAAAHGAGPRAGGGAEGDAARRALRRARRARAQGPAHLAAAAARRGPRDDDVRDARPGGGDGRLRADRRDERRPGRAGAAGRASSTSIRRTSS